MDHDVEIDAIGLKCPLPVLRLQKRLRAMARGEVARLCASDPMAEIDVPHFCAKAGHQYLGTETAEGGTAYLVRKGGE